MKLSQLMVALDLCRCTHSQGTSLAILRSLLALGIALLISSTPAPAAEKPWTIGPRTLPSPAHASEKLRQVLNEAPTPDIKAAKAAVPTTVEGWKALVAKEDGVNALVVKKAAEQTGITVQEDRVNGVRVYRVTPPTIAPEHRHQLFVHIHGGAFIKNGGLAGAGEAIVIASYLGMPVLSIDYRMPPDHPAPAARDDIVTVWGELMKNRPANTTALGGTSAGANLSLVATLRLKELGLPLPAALFIGTPGADLAKRGDTKFLNEGVDRNLVSWEAEPALAVKLYAGGKSYDDPYLSPLYADVRGLPPSYLITGTRDLMLSDTVLMHRKLRRAGVEADLHVYEGHSHADYVILYDTPESKEHFAELKAFLTRHLAK
jgi:monoterpene epsilon-lactone hydrolase